MKHWFLSLIVFGCLLLSSCGQYGSLYLPGSKPDKHHSQTVAVDTASNGKSL